MIQFTQVHKTYPKQINKSSAHHALKGISFSLKQGETLGLIGQNGAGKSTSIRLIMGYMQADKGHVHVFQGENISPASRRRIGYLPETSTFPANLTGMELLLFAGRCCDMTKKEILERAQMLLNKLGIWDARNRRISEYSKGMRQRASFAAALIHDPELLILDEPMSGLDPIGRSEIIALIHELRAQNKSILFCSHLLDDVERITNHVAILHQGNMLYDGAIAELCRSQTKWLITTNNSDPVIAYSQTELAALLHQHAAHIISVTHLKETLQDAFVRVVQGASL